MFCMALNRSMDTRVSYTTLPSPSQLKAPHRAAQGALHTCTLYGISPAWLQIQRLEL